MKWISLLVLCSVLLGCDAYSGMQRDFSKSLYPKEYAAQEARDAKKGK